MQDGVFCFGEKVTPIASTPGSGMKHGPEKWM